MIARTTLDSELRPRPTVVIVSSFFAKKLESHLGEAGTIIFKIKRSETDGEREQKRCAAARAPRAVAVRRSSSVEASPAALWAGGGGDAALRDGFGAVRLQARTKLSQVHDWICP